MGEEREKGRGPGGGAFGVFIYGWCLSGWGDRKGAFDWLQTFAGGIGGDEESNRIALAGGPLTARSTGCTSTGWTGPKSRLACSVVEQSDGLNLALAT